MAGGGGVGRDSALAAGKEEVGSRRGVGRLAWLALALLVLTGCSTSSGEKQIFPVCMSMDRLEDGRLQLAVQVHSMSEGGSYTLFTAAGDSFDQTMEILGASMPYPLHFGQLRLCLIGDELAATEELAQLLRSLGQLYTIHTDATVMVCLGNGAETLAAQQPDLGVRLSTYLDQLLARLRQEKLTPPETLQDVLRMMNSGYGDPLLGLCALNPSVGAEKKEGQGKEPEGSGGQGEQAVFNPDGRISIGEPASGVDLPAQVEAGALPRQGGNPVEYIGCAAVAQGRAALTLTAQQTRQLLTLRQHGKISHVTGDQAQMALPRDCGVEPQEAADLLTLVLGCGCDAFGFGAAAARESATEEAWRQKLGPWQQMRVQVTWTK